MTVGGQDDGSRRPELEAERSVQGQRQSRERREDEGRERWRPLGQKKWSGCLVRQELAAKAWHTVFCQPSSATV